jgi:hypothetical protein
MAKTATAVSAEQIRSWCWSRQGLDGSLAGARPEAVLERTGWMRSVGGSTPYLGLFARASLSRKQIDEAVAALAIHELPSARGCTYVVPAADFAVALRAGQGHAEAGEIQIAKKHLDVTDREIEKLSRAILDAVARGPADPKELKETLGGVVRHLGEAGKKRGLTTTLPLGLGLLQSQGEIRRVPVNGRLDHQRYQYVRWDPSPLAGMQLADDEIPIELGRRFFRWAAPATLAQFAWWAGLGKKVAQATVRALALVPLGEEGERLLFADDLEALRTHRVPEKTQISLVSSLDNLLHLRRELATVLDPSDADRQVYGEKKPAQLSTVLDLPHHAIIDRGRLVGFWEYDATSQSIVHSLFGRGGRAFDEAVTRMTAFVRDELGDARAFSLDSPESREARIAALR